MVTETDPSQLNITHQKDNEWLTSARARVCRRNKKKKRAASARSGMFLGRSEMKKVRRATGTVSHDPA